MIKDSVCLVTGGAGTIGSTIVDQLVAAGAAEIRVLDNFVRGRKENLAEALTSGRVRVIEGDIRDIDVVRDSTDGADALGKLSLTTRLRKAVEPGFLADRQPDRLWSLSRRRHPLAERQRRRADDPAPREHLERARPLADEVRRWLEAGVVQCLLNLIDECGVAPLGA